MPDTQQHTSTRSPRIGLEQDQRERVIALLKPLLADEHVLYIKARNFHWNVTGMYFQTLHDFFAAQYTQLATIIDDVAERIRSLGDFAPGSMAAFAELARLPESDHLEGQARPMLEALLADHEALVQTLRGNVEDAQMAGDAGTADFLTGLMEMHEKMAWMLRAHLR